MIPVIIGFVAGIVVGVLASVVAVVVILTRPLPERPPITFSAIGAGPVRTAGGETSLFDRLMTLTSGPS